LKFSGEQSFGMTTKLKSLGFTSGHAHLLIVAVAIFGVLMVAQSDISLGTLFANADDEVKMISYDEARAEAIAERGGVATDPGADAEAEKQLALLDRSLENGQVLGEAVGIGDIPSADTIFSQDALSKIPVKTIYNVLPDDPQRYAERLTYIESSNDVVTLLANINSGDQAVIQKSQDQATRIVQMMSAIYVPKDFVEYHRYKTMYYTSLINMADIWMKKRPETDLQTQSTLLFSVMGKVETLKAELESKYQIKL
jgi:hypothetical protein